MPSVFTYGTSKYTDEKLITITLHWIVKNTPLCTSLCGYTTQKIFEIYMQRDLLAVLCYKNLTFLLWYYRP
jgi:hypothetical protein